MVITLYLVRHGETEGSEINRYKGSIDVPLSEKGIGQIEDTSRFINQHSSKMVQAVYCSPLIRALKSAEIIASPLGLKPIVIEDLRERNFGIWEGMTFIEIKEKYPKEFENWIGNPLKYSPINGEDTIEVQDRVISALNKIVYNHLQLNSSSIVQDNSKLNKIIIVAHGGVNRIILCHIMGIPLENIFRIGQDYGGVSIIEFHEKYPIVKLLNRR